LLSEQRLQSLHEEAVCSLQKGLLARTARVACAVNANHPKNMNRQLNITDQQTKQLRALSNSCLETPEMQCEFEKKQYEQFMNIELAKKGQAYPSVQCLENDV
jgi:ABC-type uncharacterized transport system YnjBCD substrate-binding protein